MVKAYQCPNAKRSSRGLVKYMLCEAKLDYERYTYNTMEEIVTAICPYGYYCQANCRWEVSSEAKTKCEILKAKDG